MVVFKCVNLCNGWDVLPRSSQTLASHCTVYTQHITRYAMYAKWIAIVIVNLLNRILQCIQHWHSNRMACSKIDRLWDRRSERVRKIERVRENGKFLPHVGNRRTMIKLIRTALFSHIVLSHPLCIFIHRQCSVFYFPVQKRQRSFVVPSPTNRSVLCMCALIRIENGKQKSKSEREKNGKKESQLWCKYNEMEYM